MSFLSPINNNKQGIEIVPFVFKSCPSVFLVISRSMNGNVIVYEAILNKKRDIVKIDSYWLEVDTKFKQKARQKKKETDRVELNLIESQLFTPKILKKHNTKLWEIKFKQFESVFIKSTKNGVSLIRKKTHKNQIIKDKITNLHLYTQTTLAITTVPKYDIYGININKKKRFVETKLR
jgi:hypothetical protein